MGDPARLTAALSDRYRVERELGAGGMATVYLAHDLKHDRPVALKVLRPELGAVLGGERFLAEIRTTARLQHPHILPLLDSGEAAGLLYYVMPYVTGETLRARLRRETQLGVEETLRIARALAGALDYAHAAGIVHRDLKPENILFQANEPGLADFGIALAVKSAGGERLTETGLSLGTPQYMSPEQASGERAVDVRSDVYALGCVVYEMLAGEPPHTGPTTAAVLLKVMTQAPVPLGVVRPGLPAHVEAAVTRALAKAPGDRFESAGEFAGALAAPTTASAAPGKSIVVLPFDNLSPDPNDAYLADGLTEELISDLSRIRELKVIARNSAVAVKQRTRDVEEVARLVKVRYVLEGSVRRAGNALRITAQLIDGTTNAHVWTEKYAARRHIDRALELDPLSAMMHIGGASWVDYCQGRFEDVERRNATWLAAMPDEPIVMWGRCVLALAPLGRVEEMEPLVSRCLGRLPGEPIYQYLAMLRAAMVGDAAAVEASFTPELQRYCSGSTGQMALHLGQAFAKVGLADRAFPLLERAVDLGFRPYDFLARHDPLLAPIRSDPRFAALLARVVEERERGSGS